MKGGILSILKACKRLYTAWKQADKSFKIGGVMLFVFFVADVVISAIAFRHVEALLRLDMLAALAEASVFYIFLVPLMMFIAHRDIQRGRADVVDFAILFLFFQFVVANMFKLALVSGT
jgi:hypothetical protein